MTAPRIPVTNPRRKWERWRPRSFTPLGRRTALVASRTISAAPDARTLARSRPGVTSMVVGLTGTVVGPRAPLWCRYHAGTVIQIAKAKSVANNSVPSDSPEATRGGPNMLRRRKTPSHAAKAIAPRAIGVTRPRPDQSIDWGTYG